MVARLTELGRDRYGADFRGQRDVGNVYQATVH